MKIKNLYKIEYQYNIDTNTVTAIAKIDRLDKNFLLFKGICFYIAQKEFYEKRTFIGVARFKNGDENNLELAKRIARCKALRQANRYYGRLFSEMATILYDKLWSKAVLIEEDTFAKAKKYDEEIKELTRST